MLKSKEFLRDIKSKTYELRQLMLKRDWLYSTLLPKAITYKRVDVQTSGPSDQMAERYGEIYELDKIIETRIQELLSDHLLAEKYISQMTDTRYRLILELYYLGEKRITWQQVAEKMGYSEREIYKIHGNALVELDALIREGIFQNGKSVQ